MEHMNGGGTEPVGFRGKRMRQNGLYPIRRVEIELARGVLSYFLCFFHAISVPAFLIYSSTDTGTVLEDAARAVLVLVL